MPLRGWITENHKEIACSITGKSKFDARLALQNVGNCQLAQDTDYGCLSFRASWAASKIDLLG